VAGAKEAGMKREVEAIGGIGYSKGDQEMERIGANGSRLPAYLPLV
jgi:hypothetical protein